ncbi:hypothetical protein OH76DRAFT_1483274 [Lentinus brumalis]|uniref:Protein kinase domain-containing protein n=1 Tax=Lentinus brumalis TaxID=2498619 RepID=A0A371D9V5_9APHY|nr:hypothetical protein OH76DRAFT_1483274 [Polyporus brumalis]
MRRNMAEDQITLRYFSVVNGSSGDRYVFLRVASSSTMQDVIETIATQMKQQLGRIVLWKPREFLPKSGHDRLRSLMKEHGGDVSEFCNELDREALVSDIFGTGVRADAITTLVAEVPIRETVAVDAPEHLDEAKDVLIKLREGFKKVLQAGPSGTPSQNCKPNTYYKIQCGDFPILDGRYGDEPTTVAPPVENFHYVFAQLKAELRDEQLQPPEEFVRQVAELMDSVSQIQTDEVRRQTTTRSLLNNILSATFAQLVDSNNTPAGHVYSFSRVSPPLGIAGLAIVEETAELGAGGDGSVHGSFSYIQHWMNESQKALLDACFGPSFVIAIAGPYIVICGAIFTTHAIVHRLTDYIWLANSRLNDDAHAHRIARVFYALGNALTRLRSFYAQLEEPVDEVARYFPLATAYRDGDRIIKFKYTHYLKDVAEACVTYRAVECDGDEPRQLVVKFVENYGVDAHNLLAKEGLAPQLLYHGNIWLEGPEAQGCGSRQMVVMEYIEGVTAFAMLKADERHALPDGVRVAVKRAVKLLHDHNLVHGDVRLGNVVVAKPTGAEDDDVGKRVRIVDFDWAGEEGIARYPLYLSKTISWPEGVADYALIRAEHDDEMVRRLG